MNETNPIVEKKHDRMLNRKQYPLQNFSGREKIKKDIVSSAISFF